MLRRNFGAIVCVCMFAHTTTAKAGDSGVAAIVDGQKITTAELDARALKTNMKLAQSIYNARKKVLDELIMEKLLAPAAKAKGITPEALLKERIAASTTPVSNADVQAYYDANSKRMRGRTFEQVAPQIKPFLAKQRLTGARAKVLAELRKNAVVKITLDPPRAEVAIAANDPMKGPKDAKVTVIEFSDFQ